MENYKLQELTKEEIENTEGGFIWLIGMAIIGAASYGSVAIIGGVAAVGAYNGYNDTRNP